MTDYKNASPAEAKGVMVDIETASNHTHNALILSLGAVKFTMYTTGPAFEATKLWVPELREQIAAGRGTNDSTLKWWSEQSEAARAHWTNPQSPTVSCYTMLRELRDLVSGRVVWAHGVCFDIGNLETLYGQVHIGDALPWRFNDVRDARTIYRVHSVVRSRPDDGEAPNAHDPVWDCKTQIWNLWERWQGPWVVPDAFTSRASGFPAAEDALVPVV